MLKAHSLVLAAAGVKTLPPCVAPNQCAILTCALVVQVQTASSVAQYSPAMSELLACMPTPQADGPAPPPRAPSQKRSCASSHSFGVVGATGELLMIEHALT